MEIVGNRREVQSETTEAPPRPRPHCKRNGNKIGSEDKYECLQCFIIFANDRSMLRHNRKFHKEEYMQHLQKTNTVFLCYKCNQKFWSSAKLRQHSLSHGTDDKPFNCENCREGYATFAELLTHRRVCPKPRFRCKLCGMTFQNLDSLLTHKSMHIPRKRGRPPKKKTTMMPKEEEVDGRAEDQRALRFQTLWTPDKKTVVPEEEEEEVEEEEKEEEEEEKEEVDGRAEDQRASRAQMSWTPDEKTMVPKKEEEEEVDSRAEDQRARASESQQPRYNIPCSVDYCDLTFPSMEALRVHKKDVHMPQPATESWTPDKKTMVPKEEEEEEEVDGRAEDQRALRSQTSSPQGHPSESQLPMKRSQLPMKHGQLPVKRGRLPKIMVPKEEEEEEEVAGRGEDQRALRSQTSSPQGCAFESQQSRYNIPCSVDNCDLTFPSVEALRVHKKDIHRP